MSTFARVAAPFLLVALAAGCDAPAAVAALPDARLESDGGCIDLAPGVTIEQAAGQADPAREQPIRFTVRFELPVTGFDSDDVVLHGAARGAIARVLPGEDGMTYTVEVSGLLRSGPLSASVRAAAASAEQLCNNLTAESTSTDNQVRYVGKRSTP